MRLVRPLGDVLVGAALDVEARELGDAQAQQREAALVVGVDELVVRRRARPRGCRARRTGTRARTSRSDACGDRAARRRRGSRRSRRRRRTRARAAAPSWREADPRSLRVELVQRHVLDLEEERRAESSRARDEVLHDLGLPVDRRCCAAGQVAQRDPVALAGELELDAVVDDPLALHPLADARRRRGGRRCPARARRRGCAARRTRGCGPRARPTRCPRARAAGASVRPAGPAPTMPTCVLISASLGEHALGDREGAVGRGHAAVDGALQQHLLDLVGRDAVAAAPRGRASRARARGRARRAP